MSNPSDLAKRFLETDRFNSGIRPAMSPGISVSRVGGSAQVAFMRKISGGIKLALAQYRELAAFSQFASDLDEATKRQLAISSATCWLTWPPRNRNSWT